jgi:spoIIIJ-associated protein
MPETAPEGAAELARDIAQGIVERMGLEVTVEARLQEPRASDDTPSLYVNVSGPDAEQLLSYQSEGLNALQTMIQTMWAHQAKSSLRITVDADGYKAAKERRIMQMAQRMAERVITSGRPVTLEPMPASERRFVHLALRDDDRIYTESQGEGASRKVVIKLKQQ